jgi:hypothetical protein
MYNFHLVHCRGRESESPSWLEDYIAGATELVWICALAVGAPGSTGTGSQ